MTRWQKHSSTMRKISIQSVATFTAFLIVVLVPGTAAADSWALPDVKESHSPSGDFRVTVFPKTLSSQLDYFSDQVEGKEDPGAAEGVPENFARAVLPKLDTSGAFIPVSEFRLLNEVAPVTTLVADSGRWVVTLDNWHSVGYGSSVVVIYRQDGSVVQSFAIEDLLTEADVARLPRTVSSRYWRDSVEIDEATSELILTVSRCRFERDCSDPPVPLKVDLETGALQQKKRPIFSQLKPKVEVKFIDASSLESTADISGHCRAGVEHDPSEWRTTMPVKELQAVDLIAPVYTDRAWRARIHGRIIVDLLVNREGAVDCFALLKKLPMGLTETTQDIVFSWRFVPPPVLSRTAYVVEFSRVEESPP